MLKIGEFASLSSISIHMLRHYDKIGMLCPQYVDVNNGYRYYNIEQLVQANQIVSMKNLGFGLEEIKNALAMTQEELEALLNEKLQSKILESKILKHQIDTLEKTILLQQNAEEYALSIVLKTMPEMHMVSYRDTILEFSEEGRLWGELTKECEVYNVAVNTNSVAMAIQHMISSEKNEIDVEVLLSTNKEQKACGNLKFRKLPERQVASIIFKGSYSQIGRINTFVARWLETNHYEICDKAFSIYYNSPRESQSEDQFVTELCFPVCEKSS